MVVIPSAPPEPAIIVDGVPLKTKLARALMVRRLRALGLTLPLLAFLLAAFIIPVLVFLWQGVNDDTYARYMPHSTPALEAWDGVSEPTEAMYAALQKDLAQARKDKTIGKVATRVNRELPGGRSLFTSTARKAARFEAPYREAMVDHKPAWGQLKTWQALRVAAARYTPTYLATSVDLKYRGDGSIRRQDEKRRIHLALFWRTVEISALVTIFCLLLGYPVAYLLSNLPQRSTNLLLILVLLPFWTSILVRTTAWIAILQGNGVLNDLFVAFGVIGDDSRFSMVYNRTGTLVAMTHILLPFMILPLYAVMRTIPKAYVQAAHSLGANGWVAFWRVYLPQTLPGIGAGVVLVFILATGYYITPALVGGQDGQMISNLIDFHMRRSLNWPLAAAMGFVLLVLVMFLYWLYDRVSGIDRMRLG